MSDEYRVLTTTPLFTELMRRCSLQGLEAHEQTETAAAPLVAELSDVTLEHT